MLLISATECYSFHFVVFFAVLSGDLPTELIGLRYTYTFGNTLYDQLLVVFKFVWKFLNPNMKVIL